MEISEVLWYNAPTMVSGLERWAKDARAHGYDDEADVIKNQAEVFRNTGVPEVFPPDVVRTEPETKGRISEGLLAPKDLKEARAWLVEILSSVKHEQGKSILTQELATAINERVIQHLGDEVKIRDIVLPSNNLETHQDREQVGGFEGLEKVDTRVRAVYNRFLNPFIRFGYQTLGEIRDAAPETLVITRRIGKMYSTFAKTAFARLQHPEG